MGAYKQLGITRVVTFGPFLKRVRIEPQSPTSTNPHLFSLPLTQTATYLFFISTLYITKIIPIGLYK